MKCLKEKSEKKHETTIANSQNSALSLNLCFVLHMQRVHHCCRGTFEKRILGLFPLRLILHFDEALIFSIVVQLQEETVNNDYYNASYNDSRHRAADDNCSLINSMRQVCIFNINFATGLKLHTV